MQGALQIVKTSEVLHASIQSLLAAQESAAEVQAGRSDCVNGVPIRINLDHVSVFALLFNPD